MDASRANVAQLKQAKDKFELEKSSFEANNEKIDQANHAIQEFEIALANKRAELKSLLQTGESLKNSYQLAFDQHETLRRSLDARRGQIQQWCDDLKQAKDK